MSSVPSVPSSPEVVVRHDWTLAEVRAIHDLPLLELLYRAQTVHRATFGDPKVQLCSLLSIKTGGCPEDCAYCPQSARYETGVKAERLMETGDVLEAAREARAAGATRFCMGAAWREVKDGPQFERVLAMVRGVRGARDGGLRARSACSRADQARRLKEAGLSAYNHNLDTCPEFYGEIISTRDYQDRLRTLAAVREAGIGVCSGGILGMGESVDDRCELLRTLANQEAHPESVPINALVAVPGTPLENQRPVQPVEMVRVIATARILMPRAMVRLSAGRMQMSQEAQLLCMMAGANSLFFGEKLLTTGNPEYVDDMALLEGAGLKPLEPKLDTAAAAVSSVADAWARGELADLGRRGLLRTLEPLGSPQGPVVRIGGQSLVNFSSNDYLGLAADPRVVHAFAAGLERWGVGAGASRLVVGDTEAHRRLEARLAAFEATEAVLLFNGGYPANLGLVQALVGRGDLVVSDALNHASLVDGCRLSRAEVAVVPHGDVDGFARALSGGTFRRKLVVTDAVFSMDGDPAPLAALAEVCAGAGAALLVDEAHATGVLGARGAGLCEAASVRPDVRMGTLGKALGGFGAYAATTRAVADLLVNRARSVVFSTTLPPALCEAMVVAVDVLEHDPELRRTPLAQHPPVRRRAATAGHRRRAAERHRPGRPRDSGAGGPGLRLPPRARAPGEAHPPPHRPRGHEPAPVRPLRRTHGGADRPRAPVTRGGTRAWTRHGMSSCSRWTGPTSGTRSPRCRSGRRTIR